MADLDLASVVKLNVLAEKAAASLSDSNQHIHFLAEIDTNAPSELRASMPKRSGLEISMVIDISGSMAGAKLDQVKLAASSVIESLEAEDIIHIIVYNATASVICNGEPGTNKDTLKATVQRMVASGGTNMAAALDLISRQFSSYRVRRSERGEAQPDRIKRVFLYSDGNPSVGVTGEVELGLLASRMFEEHNASISAFGIGEDINARLMQQVSEAAQGHYDFLTVRRIQEFTDRAFGSAARVIATRCEVLLSALNGCRFASGETEQTIIVGDVRIDNRHQMLVKVVLPEQREETTTAVLRATLTCLPSNNPLGRPLEVEQTTALHFSPVFCFDRNPTVGVYVALAQMGEALQAVEGLLDRRNVSDAKNILSAAIEELATYEASDERGYVSTQLRRARRALERLQNTNDTRRVMLELGNQRDQLDRQFSECDMASSDSSNHTPPRNRSPTSHGAHLGFMGSGSSDTDDDTSDEMLPATHTLNLRRQDTQDTDATDPDGETLRHGRFDTDTDDDMPSAGIHQRRSSLQRQDTQDTDATDTDDGNDYEPPTRISPQRDGSGTHTLVADSSPFVGLRPLDAASVNPSAAVPEAFLCPITKSLMREPVCAGDGHTYERSAIEDWFRIGRTVSPMTNLAMETGVRPNLLLRSMIAEWIDAHST